MKTILIFSGGMDSTTLLYHLLSLQHEVKCISYDYGQRHKKELEQAKVTCEKLHIEHKIIDISFLNSLLSNSALTGKIDVPHGHYEDESMKLTVVPNRNMIMASIAIGWAVNEKFDAVAMGVHAGDHAIYADCRPQFIEKLSEIAQIANYSAVLVLTPFLFMDKGDIAIRGKELNVPYENTWTCYEGKDTPCGLCGACQERKFAFEKAQLADPLTKQNG